MTRSFFDTNVLVYLFDADAPDKKETAQNLFEEQAASGQAVLSTQVLQEFYVTVTRKLADPLTEDMAEQTLRRLAALPLVNIDANHILSAVDRSRALGYSFWDALIIEAAVAGRAEILFTEDLQHGQTIDGLRIENPFL